MIQKAQNGTYSRPSIDPQTAARLRQIALYHKRPESEILRDLIARQYAHDHAGIMASLDKLADSDTDEGPA